MAKGLFGFLREVRDPADVKANLINWLVVGIMALTFITFGKWFFTRYYVPGLSEMFRAA